MILDGLLTVLQALFGWLALIILQMLLRIVDILEKFFNVFAGTQPVYYQGEPNYLFNLFFSNNAISNLFWAMAIIAVVISFGFCIVAVTRKVVDVSGTSKHTLGQIVSNFIRSLIVILLLNICIIAAINVTSVIFDRINFSLNHANDLQLSKEKKYTDEEFATMTRILATMGNYAANPSAESRYNINACFNAIRGEMITLFDAGCFNFDFSAAQTGRHTWQSALAQVAKSANLEEDLQLDTYYPTVQESIILCFEQLKTNPNFKPQETAVMASGITDSMSTAKMIFLTASMGAEENQQFKDGSFEDALRRSYLTGEKDFLSFSDVYEDFAITRINYAVGLIVAVAIILFMAKVILLFVVRMLNLILLYVISPLFASSMSLDDGSRFQNWTQSFIMQLLAAYAGVVMMRLYLLIIPIVISSDFQFFEPGTWENRYNIYGQLLIVLAGAWAVSRASGLVSGALSGNASGALQDADSTFGRGISEMIGTGRLHKELSRMRMNKDRAKSYARGRYDKALRPNGAEDESAKAMKELKDVIAGSRDGDRTGAEPEKQTYEDGGSNAALERMRQSAGLDGNVPDKSYMDDGDREHSRMSKLRSQMGFDAPASSRRSFDESQDTFSLDALPDLGKDKSSGNQNTKTTPGGAVRNPIGGTTSNQTDGGNKTTPTTTGGTTSTKNSGSSRTTTGGSGKTTAPTIGGGGKTTASTTGGGGKTTASTIGGATSTKDSGSSRTTITGGNQRNTVGSGSGRRYTVTGGVGSRTTTGGGSKTTAPTTGGGGNATTTTIGGGGNATTTTIGGGGNATTTTGGGGKTTTTTIGGGGKPTTNVAGSTTIVGGTSNVGGVTNVEGGVNVTRDSTNRTATNRDTTNRDTTNGNTTNRDTTNHNTANRESVGNVTGTRENNGRTSTGEMNVSRPTVNSTPDTVATTGVTGQQVSTAPSKSVQQREELKTLLRNRTDQK